MRLKAYYTLYTVVDDLRIVIFDIFLYHETIIRVIILIIHGKFVIINYISLIKKKLLMIGTGKL